MFVEINDYFLSINADNSSEFCGIQQSSRVQNLRRKFIRSMSWKIRVLFVTCSIVFVMHLPTVKLYKRRNCKLSPELNQTLEIGEYWLHKETCHIYWCCEETKRYGELLTYNCSHTVLRLYPPLTRECRKQHCIPEFAWDNDLFTKDDAFLRESS